MIDRLLLRPMPDAREEAVAQYTRDLEPLAPRSTPETRAAAIEFIQWSTTGGKAPSPAALPKPWPDVHCVAQAFRTIGGDPDSETGRALARLDGVAPATRLEIVRYFQQIRTAYRDLDVPPLSPVEWRRMCATNFRSIAVAHGVQPTTMDRFRSAMDAITHILDRSIRFAYLSFSLIAIILPFIPEDFASVLSKDPRYRSGARMLRTVTRIIGYIQSVPRPGRRNVQPDRKKALDPPERTGPIVHVPSNPAVVAVLESIWKGGERIPKLSEGWQDENAGPLYVHHGQRGGQIIVYPDPDDLEEAPARVARWRYVKALSPLTSDVALAVLSEMATRLRNLQTYNPLADPVEITLDDLFGYRRLRAGRGGRELRVRLCEEMERLFSLRIDVDAYPFRDRESDQCSDRRSDRFGVDRVVRYRDKLLDGVTLEGSYDSGRGVSWLVRAGGWAEWWLNPETRLYLASMERRFVELHHRSPRAASAAMAKKIGQRLLIYRQASRSLTVIELPMARILAMIGELVLPEERGKHWAGRTRDRFEDALLMLQEVGVLAAVEWPSGYGPGDPDRFRGWTARWLDAPVRIVFADTGRNGRSSKPTHPARSRVGDVNGRGGTNGRGGDYDRLRAVRVARGWTQERLARNLGISAPYLSQIENGYRAPGEALEHRLMEWILG